MSNKYLEKVKDEYHEQEKYDDFDVDFGSNDSNEYVIVGEHKDIDSFVNFAIECLNLNSEEYGEIEIENLLDVTFVFNDEYTKCTECGKVIKTTPSGCTWQPDYFVGDGYIVCEECFNNNEDYQEAYLEDRINNHEKAVGDLLEEGKLIDLGFKKIEMEYEQGMYDRHDNPSEILNELNEKYEEVVFVITDSNTFMTRFVPYVRGEIV